MLNSILLPAAMFYAGCVQVTEVTHQHLQSLYSWEPTGGVEVKGKVCALGPPTHSSRAAHTSQ